MQAKGGRISLDINGRVYSGRSEARIMPARATVESDVNWDGTGYAMVEPQLASAELSFDRGIGLYWTEIEMLRTVDVMFVETDARVVHYFTNARITGKPTINTKTGEVTGLTIKSDQYRASRR